MEPKSRDDKEGWLILCVSTLQNINIKAVDFRQVSHHVYLNLETEVQLVCRELVNNFQYCKS